MRVSLKVFTTIMNNGTRLRVILNVTDQCNFNCIALAAYANAKRTKCQAGEKNRNYLLK